MDRRDFLKAGLATTAAVALSPSLKGWVPQHNWHKYDFGPGPQVKDRLYQGPFPSYAPEDYFGQEPVVIQYTLPGKQLLNAFGILVIPVTGTLFGQFLIQQVRCHINLACLIANRYDFSCQFSHESGNQQTHDDKCYIAKGRCSFQRL